MQEDKLKKITKNVLKAGFKKYNENSIKENKFILTQLLNLFT